MYPENLKYTKTHEWLRVEGQKGYVGLSHYAQEQLGDIVFVELPEIGAEVTQGKAFGVVESVKAVSDCYAPVSGKVVERNENLETSPELINKDPYGEGWLIAIEMSDPSEVNNLLDVDAYKKHMEEEGHH